MGPICHQVIIKESERELNESKRWKRLHLVIQWNPDYSNLPQGKGNSSENRIVPEMGGGGGRGGGGKITVRD